jgi:hypothetical protein
VTVFDRKGVRVRRHLAVEDQVTDTADKLDLKLKDT